METSEISIHLCKVFLAIKATNGWAASKDVACSSGVAERTTRAHLLRLVKMGLLDQAEVFPAHRYRFAAKADKRNRAMLQRINGACDIFGLA